MVSSKPRPQLLCHPRIRSRIYRSSSLLAIVSTSIRDSGKTDSLCRDQFGRCMGFAGGVNVDAQAHEDPPCSAAPLAMENDKGVFRDGPGRFRTLDKIFESFTPACCYYECRCEMPHSRFELPVRYLHRSDCQRILARIVDLPMDVPRSRRHIWR